MPAVEHERVHAPVECGPRQAGAQWRVQHQQQPSEARDAEHISLRIAAAGAIADSARRACLHHAFHSCARGSGQHGAVPAKRQPASARYRRMPRERGARDVHWQRHAGLVHGRHDGVAPENARCRGRGHRRRLSRFTGIRSTGLPCFQRETSGPATPITLHPVEFDAPIGCAGVAVYPGDIVVGDAEGVVVIPRDLADEVADEAFAAVQYEEFAAAHLRRGRSIFGLFPATPESKAEYERWVAAGRPSLDKYLEK